MLPIGPLSKEPLGSPVEKLPAYVHVADRIRRAIHLGHFAPGDRLPSESELGERLGFSRVTVREAVRHLEGEGYLETRRGARGGLFVRRIHDSEEKQLAYLRSHWKEIDDLFDFRLGVECMAARLAAARRTSENLARMAAALAAFRGGDSSPNFRRADSEFHLAVAEASANLHLQHAIEEARAGMFLPFDVLRVEPSSWAQQPGQHEAVYDAIEGRDAERAATAMAAHLEASRKHVRDIIWDGERGAGAQPGEAEGRRRGA